MFNQAVRVEILASSLVCHAIAWLLFYVAAADSLVLAAYASDFQILLAASFSLSLASHLVSKQWIIGMLLVLRMIVLIIIGVPFGDDMGVKVILLLALVVESMFLIKTPQDYGFTAIIITIFLLAQRMYSLVQVSFPSPQPLVEIVIVAVSIMVLFLIATLKSLLRKVAIAENEVDRLSESNIRLADTNLSFQDSFIRGKTDIIQEERKRIAREVHDSVAYVLTNLIMMIEDAKDLQRNSDERLSNHLQIARDHANQGLIEIRQAIKHLRDRSERKPRDIAEIYALASAFEKAAHINVEINVVSHDVFELRLSDTVYNALFRLIQESMTNAVVHGRSSRIVIFIERRGDHLHVSISDNGSGSAQIIEGLGILGMKERIAEINGGISFSASSQGFALTAWLPIVQTEEYEKDPNPAG
jgi:signal transduction histidine kinase